MRESYFAGGCFWCIAALISTLNGVVKIISGFSGGDEANPTYEEVKKQLTGHRETIKVEYDETKISYKEILDMFLNNIDPFDGEGQFIDRGLSYSPAIFYTNNEEKQQAIESIKIIEKSYNKMCKVAILPYKNFYPAEEYHQNFHIKNPEKIKQEFAVSGRKILNKEGN